MIKSMIREKILEMIAEGKITLNGCQVNFGGENNLTCYQHHEHDDMPQLEHDDASQGERSAQSNTAEGCLNDHLANDLARRELAKFQKAGYLDENFQPIHLTRPQMGCIVLVIGNTLGLTSQWKDFGYLWNIDSELLRSQFNKGKDSEPTRKFYKKIYAL